MSNIVSIYCGSPFIETWVNDDLFPYETVIAAEGGQLTVESKIILKEGDIIDDPDEELHRVVTKTTKDTLDYVTWYDSVGRHG